MDMLFYPESYIATYRRWPQTDITWVYEGGAGEGKEVTALTRKDVSKLTIQTTGCPA